VADRGKGLYACVRRGGKGGKRKKLKRSKSQYLPAHQKSLFPDEEGGGERGKLRNRKGRRKGTHTFSTKREKASMIHLQGGGGKQIGDKGGGRP